MLKLISLMLIMYAVQNTIYYMGSESIKSTYQNSDQNFSSYNIKEFLQKEKEIKNELWNCVTLKLGGNIGPSVKYKNEYWRIFFCFFLHENFSHLFLNVLMIMYYRNSILKIDKKNFYVFLLISIFNANLTSNLISPNFLKIGSSFLSSLFLMFSFLNNFGKIDRKFLIDSFLMGFLLMNIFNNSVDNTVHMFGLISSFIFWIFLKRKISFMYFYVFSIMYSLIILFWINNSSTIQDEEFVVQLNYGCPNSFLDLINSNSTN